MKSVSKRLPVKLEFFTLTITGNEQAEHLNRNFRFL